MGWRALCLSYEFSRRFNLAQVTKKEILPRLTFESYEKSDPVAKSSFEKSDLLSLQFLAQSCHSASKPFYFVGLKKWMTASTNQIANKMAKLRTAQSILIFLKLIFQDPV